MISRGIVDGTPERTCGAPGSGSATNGATVAERRQRRVAGITAVPIPARWPDPYRRNTNGERAKSAQHVGIDCAQLSKIAARTGFPTVAEHEQLRRTADQQQSLIDQIMQE